MDTQIASFKNRIIEENKYNTTSKRKFSKILKQDIVQFVNEKKLSSLRASQLLGIGNTTMEKWRSNYNVQFHKIKISPAVTTHAKKKKKLANIDVIKTNQTVLIILITLLICERIFLHLVS